MNIAEILEATADQPPDESLSTVITALKGQRLVVPLAGKLDPDGTMLMVFATDNQGLDWLYVYTSEEALAEADIGEATFRWLGFDQIIAVTNARGGIFIDAHHPRRKKPIPAAYFPDIAAYLAQ